MHVLHACIWTTYRTTSTCRSEGGRAIVYPQNTHMSNKKKNKHLFLPSFTISKGSSINIDIGNNVQDEHLRLQTHWFVGSTEESRKEVSVAQ